MAAVRRNITASAADAQTFVDGVLALKGTDVGIRSSQLGLAAGPRADDAPLSWWDLFVIWHAWSMRQTTGGGRNAAHSGPAFLPWHRFFMVVLEVQMRNLLGLGPDDFGLPYWDWAADGDQDSSFGQTSAAVFNIVGGNGDASGTLTDGPFSAARGFIVNVEDGPNEDLRATSRGLRRNLGRRGLLPRRRDVAEMMQFGTYDTEPWNMNSRGSFRNALEGWTGLAGHNQVHVFVGGDMLSASSPNDPIFFLNHCNVDRIWAAQQEASPAGWYEPGGNSPWSDPLFRHRTNDPIYSILTQAQPSVASMLNVRDWYTYDTLAT